MFIIGKSFILYIGNLRPLMNAVSLKPMSEITLQDCLILKNAVRIA